MEEDRMLSDEILLGLIKNNGGGGTTDYNSLSNKPQIAGTELQGDKSLADLGIASAQDVKKEFIGTSDEWEQLSTEQKKEYDTYQFTNDYSEALVPNYSTAEQKTGQKWTDGKDIYSKTYIFADTFALDNSAYTAVITDVSIDTLVKVESVASDGTVNDGRLRWNHSNGEVKAAASVAVNLVEPTITIFYTKATA